MSSSLNTPPAAVPYPDMAAGAGTAARARSIPRRASILAAIKTLIYQSLMFSVALLPTRLAYRLSCAIGRMRYRRRKNTAGRLTRAMQSKLAISAEEAGQWARRYFELEAWDEVETWHCRWAGPDKINKLAALEGLENLDCALAGGKGAVLCTGHIRGLFVLMLALAQRGYKLHGIRRKPLGLQGPLGRWFNEQHTLMRHGACSFLWMERDSLKTAVQAGGVLRRNEILLLLLDSRFSAQCVNANLLGGTVPIPSGTHIIARTLGAPFVGLFIDLDDRGPLRHRIQFGKPYYPTSDIPASVQYSVAEMEKGIVSNPGTWLWFEAREIWDGHGD
ncbi:MAG TPA: hypothetical protein VMO17_18300 [Terriglobia bacterium]|nr:hypothetical protein [Terriglobia bacterium]